jgi:hypothetical protein
MSYFRGDPYIWSDRERLHLWTIAADDTLGHDAYAAGVEIPEATMDQFAVMRFAELLELGIARKTIAEALDNTNFGGDCLRRHAGTLQALITAFESDRAR